MRRNPVAKEKASFSKQLSTARRRLRVLRTRIKQGPLRKGDVAAVFKVLNEIPQVSGVVLNGRPADPYRALAAWAMGGHSEFARLLPPTEEGKRDLALLLIRDYLLEERTARKLYSVEKPHLEHRHSVTRVLASTPGFRVSRSYHATTEVERGRLAHRELARAYLQTLAQFPFVTWGKYKRRLMQLLLTLRRSNSEKWEKGASHIWTAVLHTQGWTLLPKLGIPARELVGPYTYMRPADYIRAQLEPDPVRLMSSSSSLAQSPNVSELIAEINLRGNHHLDRFDQALGAAVHAYVTTHGNLTPSVQTVLNINRQVERERELKGKAEAFETMEKWWAAILEAGLLSNIRLIQKALADHGGEWIVFDGSKEVMEELWYRVKTWGLCTIDQMSYWAEQSPKNWECYYLILAADRKRGTVVGLDASYVCPHTSWATGVNNKLDPAAYEYFNSDRVWWWKNA